MPSLKQDKQAFPESSVWNEYQLWSSLGAVRQSLATTNVALRIFWLLLLTLGIVVTGLHAYTIVRLYLEYETHIKTVTHANQSVQLPALTLCNLNPIAQTSDAQLKQLAAAQTQLSPSLLKNEKLSESYKSYLKNENKVDRAVYLRKDGWVRDIFGLEKPAISTPASPIERFPESQYYVRGDAETVVPGGKDYGEGYSGVEKNYALGKYPTDKHKINTLFFDKLTKQEDGQRVLEMVENPLFVMEDGEFKPLVNFSSNKIFRLKNGKYQRYHPFFLDKSDSDTCAIFYRNDTSHEYYKTDASLTYEGKQLYVLDRDWNSYLHVYVPYTSGCAPEYMTETVCKQMTDCPLDWWRNSDAPSNSWLEKLENSQLDDAQDVRSAFSFTESMAKDGYKAQDLIVECTMDRTNCQPDMHFETFSHKNYGNCYTFNDASVRQPVETEFSGRQYGLRLTLNLDTMKYLGLLAPDYGALFSVHDPHATPDIDRDSFVGHPGMMTEVAVELLHVSRLSSPYEDDCFNNCQQQLQYRLTLSHSDWPSEPYMKLKMMSQYGRKPVATMMLDKKLNSEAEWEIEKDLIRLHLYYKSLDIQNNIQTATYPFVRFAAEMGGVLGLYVGLSLVAFFELIQLIYLLINTPKPPDVKSREKPNLKNPNKKKEGPVSMDSL